MDLDGLLDQPRAQRRGRHRPRPRPARGTGVESLDVYERNGDGHTLRRHCGVPPELEGLRLERHPWLAATGSFPDLATAQRAVESCVTANHDKIAGWRWDERPRLAIRCDMGEVIGGVLTRAAWLAGETRPRPASCVRAVLQRNHRYPSGFAVLTAYPQLP